METRVYKVYKFEELSDEGKEKALENYADINTAFAWYESTYDDAKRIGIEIEEFDLGYGTIKVKGLHSAKEMARAILKEHGKDCETYKDAKQFLRDYQDLELPKDDEGYKTDEAMDELNANFIRTIGEDYRIMLQREFDYLTCSDAIKETLIANEYDFTENGKID